MKKKLLLTLVMTAIFVCLFAICVSAAPRNYQSYEVELVSGEKITVYETQCWDQWQGHIHMTDTVYTEAPVDTDGQYARLDWSTVKVIDFTNAWGHVYNSSSQTWDLKRGTNGGYSLLIINDAKNDSLSMKKAVNLEKVISGAATSFVGATFTGAPALKEIVIE